MDVARSSRRLPFIVQAQLLDSCRDLPAPENTVILENHSEVARISKFEKDLVIRSGRNSSKWYSSSGFEYWIGN